MADFMKKQSVGAYFNMIAAVLGVVGIVAAVICSNMTVTYALGNLGTVIALGCSGIVLAVLAVVLPNKFGNHDILLKCSFLFSLPAFKVLNCLHTSLFVVLGSGGGRIIFVFI